MELIIKSNNPELLRELTELISESTEVISDLLATQSINTCEVYYDKDINIINIE